MSVWVAQLLCPSRHCIIGLAYMEGQKDLVEEKIFEALDKGGIKRECWICLSRDLHVEHGRTKFKTLEEAHEPLMSIQRDNMRTRMLVQLLRENGYGDMVAEIKSGQPIPVEVALKIAELLGLKGGPDETGR